MTTKPLPNPFFLPNERPPSMSAPAELIPSSSPDDQPPTATSPGAAASADPPAGHIQPAPRSVAPRPMIAISLLTAHPGNVRRDLDLSADFVASIEANGVLVPLRITPADGGYRVIDGHRRLAAAVKAGLAEVPADLAGDRAGDEPGQYLDMWTSHRHRNPLTPIEEADALFAAHEAGATKARIRKSTGLKNPQVSAALSAARLSGDTRATVEALSSEMTLEDLAVFAEFDGSRPRLPGSPTLPGGVAAWSTRRNCSARNAPNAPSTGACAATWKTRASLSPTPCRPVRSC